MIDGLKLIALAQFKECAPESPVFFIIAEPPIHDLCLGMKGKPEEGAVCGRRALEQFERR